MKFYNTHRTAISNNRILKLENDAVTFKWRDYKDNSQVKEMTVSAEEFIRRFLLHVLPSGFMKIHHYGLFGNRNRESKSKLCKRLTNTPIFIKPGFSTADILVKMLGLKAIQCPYCGSVHLTRGRCFSPPEFLLI